MAQITRLGRSLTYVLRHHHEWRLTEREVIDIVLQEWGVQREQAGYRRGLAAGWNRPPLPPTTIRRAA